MDSLVTSKPINHVFLVGFMGSGKSTIGRLLALQLGWRFIDLDEEIVRHERMPIEQIFEERGEPYFRGVEVRLLQNLLAHHKTVIALGGGTPAQESAWPVLAQGLVIYLRCHPDELFRRLKDEVNRPMLSRVPPAERPLFIRTLLSVRESFYMRAEITVDSFAQHTPNETATIISQLIRDRL